VNPQKFNYKISFCKIKMLINGAVILLNQFKIIKLSLKKNKDKKKNKKDHL
jgi:hypothetical protein